MPMANLGCRKMGSSNSTALLQDTKESMNVVASTSEGRREGSGGLLQTLETSLDDIRSLIICRVCIRPLFEPYTIECGHTFCYGCLSRWFERDRIKKTCPDCRAEISRAPAPAYLVRDMTQIFSTRAELLPAGETTEEHKKWQEEEAALVEKDRSCTGPAGGLFRGCFRRRRLERRMRRPIRDTADGVERCPRCTWELEDGVCQSCGYPSGDDELSDSAAEDYGPNFPNGIYGDADDMDEAILDVLDDGGHIYHDVDFDSASPSDVEYFDDENNRFRIMEREVMRVQRNGERSFGTQAGTPYDSFDDGYDDGSEDEDAGSLDGFVVDDDENRQHSPSSSVRSPQWETDDGTGDEDMDTQGSENGFAAEAEENSNQDDMSIIGSHSQYDSEEDSDEGPVPPPRRQTARRVPTTNASSSDDDIQPMALNRGRRHRNAARERPNAVLQSQRIVPHHARIIRADRERSFGVPIEIDSDSDAPISASQPSRRRRTQNSHSIVENSGADGSGSSNSTATAGRLSPASAVPRSRGSRQVNHGRNQHSPVTIESSPVRSQNEENRTSASGNTSHPSGNAMGPLASPSNQSLSDPHGPQSDDLNHNQSPSASTHNRRNQGNVPWSPFPPRSHRNSPALGPSRPYPSEERDLQSFRRHAQKTDRKADRRRKKAERQRQRSGESVQSVSPLQNPTSGH